ncbi:MAG TPA: response regulator [Opitutaceae bacterium]
MSLTEAIDLLLVEDSPHDAELVVRAMRRSRPSVRIGVVRDGVEALDYVFGEGTHAQRGTVELPRLILLDLKLPRIDGLEVLRRLKSDPVTQRIFVVMLTSSREPRDIEETYRLGVNSYVVKPVSYERLMMAVQEIGSYWLALNQGLGAET